jgi:lantibiotic modifying enzyme
MRSDAAAFLEVGAALARELSDSAIWHEGRCNWVGRVSAEQPPPAGEDDATHAALGPDLYAGTSGVALSLAQAAVTLDDPSLRTAALGAIGHALHHARRTHEAVGDGLHTGLVGVAYAAARVARLLDAEAALLGAGEVLRAWRRNRLVAPASDVVGGCAGAIVGLLALTDLVDEGWLLEAAVGLGEVLVTRADITPAGWSWPAPRQRRMQHLCGYAHGAAGIGHALLELFAVTGDARFLQAGAGAFHYVRSWRDPRTGTWPELRSVARRAGREAPVPPAQSWCHGAPGIALSLLRTARIRGTTAARADADAAVAATRLQVVQMLTRPTEDFSLCHGAAGAADALLYAPDTPDVATATDLGLLGIERYQRPGASFPCGPSRGRTPGLFFGLAGIAMFYLRLGDDGVPTPLIIHRFDRLDNCVETCVQSQSTKAP